MTGNSMTNEKLLYLLQCVYFDNIDQAKANEAVEAMHDSVEWIHTQSLWCIKVCHLSHGMDSGICPAGSMDADLFLRHFGDGIFNQILNRVSTRLRRPSFKRPAIIGYR